MDRLYLYTFLLVALICCAPKSSLDSSPESSSITVAAASDLIDAFTELGKKFQAERKIKVVFSFGSTGLLARQIEEGAPFDIFAAANESFVQRLEKMGLILQGSRQIYAQGRITLWQREDAPVPVNELRDLTNPAIKRIAIANPEHAPYGLAAKQVLQRTGLWESVKEKIVFGENISQTLQFAQTANVDISIVALSISSRPGGRYVLIDDKLHQPINQALCILAGTKNELLARQFVTFINELPGRAIMKRYGFLFPE